MYPSSSSASSSSASSSQQHSSITQTGLTRYGSAPGSLLTSTVEAVIGGRSRLLSGHYYSGDSSESICKEQTPSYEAYAGSALLRQKSSPPGFLSHLATTASAPHNNHNHNHNGGGFTITRGGGSSHAGSRFKAELSFTGQECLSGISENVVDPTSDHTTSASTSTGFGWDNSNSIVFSAPPTKRSKADDADLLHCLTALDSQFSLPQTTLEMATVEKLLHIPEDSVPCKIRAKRGCATHPRSIAERERRTRISGKLKKLQDLVPNMDKQTSYADMLDLAVQHIKGLQGQVQKFHKELENCTCGCKENT